MGAEPWSYFVPFETNVADALHKLRISVFESGNYRGSELKPQSPEEALVNMEDSGTASILDIMQISATPDFCSVCPLPEAKLERFFGTVRPTHAIVASKLGFYEEIDRGQGIYVVVYKDDFADEYFFAGYSFD
jgi:hypothetical protein